MNQKDKIIISRAGCGRIDPDTPAGRGDEDVQILCTVCQGKAVISSRTVKDPKVSDLYCSCKDSRCGHTFVMTLAFSHTLSPSSKHVNSMLLEMLRSMPKAEQQQILQQVTH